MGFDRLSLDLVALAVLALERYRHLLVEPDASHQVPVGPGRLEQFQVEKVAVLHRMQGLFHDRMGETVRIQGRQHFCRILVLDEIDDVFLSIAQPWWASFHSKPRQVSVGVVAAATVVVEIDGQVVLHPQVVEPPGQAARNIRARGSAGRGSWSRVAAPRR